jgi:hypothetical protein
MPYLPTFPEIVGVELVIVERPAFLSPASQFIGFRKLIGREQK